MRVKKTGGMRAVRSLVVPILPFVVLAAPAVALADGRVALVVGNSAYAHIGRLPNPDNDARDMSSALRRLGFEVTTEFDADRMELTEALRAFLWMPLAAARVRGGAVELPRLRVRSPVAMHKPWNAWRWPTRQRARSGPC